MKLILVIGILLLIYLINNRNLIEPVILSCCGNVKLGSDFDETDPDPPKKIKRCLKSWGTPCTNIGSPDCCNAHDTCKPTKEGGKCRKRDGSGYYIYNKYGEKKEYTAEDERKERKKNKEKSKKDRKGTMLSIKDKMHNINYILAGIIGVIVIFLTGFLIKNTLKGQSKTSKPGFDINKYRRNRYDNTSFEFDRRRF